MHFPKLSQNDERDLCLEAIRLKAEGSKCFARLTAKRFLENNNMDPDRLFVRRLAARIRNCIKNMENFICTRKYCNPFLTSKGFAAKLVEDSLSSIGFKI